MTSSYDIFLAAIVLRINRVTLNNLEIGLIFLFLVSGIYTSTQHVVQNYIVK